jgi:hypothetical protein
MTLSQLDTTRNKSVRGRSVNVRVSIENGSDRKDGRRRDLFVRVLNGV